MNWNFFNVILLGISFMFVFTAFQTCQMIEVNGKSLVTEHALIPSRVSYCDDNDDDDDDDFLSIIHAKV